MDYNELVQAVVDITDRDENIPAIQYAIAKATLKFHLSDFWLRDLMEVKTAPDVDAFPRYELYCSTRLPGFRKISYLKGYDDVTDPANPVEQQDFDESSPSGTKDIYGVKKQDRFYLAGDVITCWASQACPKFLIGYWRTPNVAAANYSSWIATMLGYPIVDEAAAEIFGAVGDNDEAARRRDMFPKNLLMVRINDVEATGR